MLRAGPVENGGKRDDIIVLAVDDEAFCWDALCAKPVHRGPDQHYALRMKAARNTSLDEGAERETRKDNRQLSILLPEISGYGEEILGLSTALVKRAVRSTHAAEIRACCDVAKREERLRERGHHLVVLGAAV